MNAFEMMGYAAYWDGYDLDAVKGCVTRQQHNDYVRGWMRGESEDN